MQLVDVGTTLVGGVLAVARRLIFCAREGRGVSLDHDLGIGVRDDERTGYDVLLWIEEQVGTGWPASECPN
jgi:hypothetical protein